MQDVLLLAAAAAAVALGWVFAKWLDWLINVLEQEESDASDEPPERKK